jgi:nitrogen fixation protein NifU and related proteins
MSQRMTDDEFDAIVDKIQAEAFAEARGAYGEKGFVRWRSPEYYGRMAACDGHGRVTGKCGDTMEMFLRIAGDRVTEASYTTTGCGSSSLCGSFAAELAIGRSLEELFDLTGEDVLERIDTFPESERHCAFLAIETLHEAVNDSLVRMVDETNWSQK